MYSYYTIVIFYRSIKADDPNFCRKIYIRELKWILVMLLHLLFKEEL